MENYTNEWRSGHRRWNPAGSFASNIGISTARPPFTEQRSFGSTDLSHAADYTTPDTATYPVTRYLPLSFLISSFWPRSFSCLLTRAPSYTTQLNASTCCVQTRSIEFSSRDRLRFSVYDLLCRDISFAILETRILILFSNQKTNSSVVDAV